MGVRPPALPLSFGAFSSRSFRVTCPRKSHQRATDERGLGFGRRQLGGLGVLCTASKDRVTHKLTFRGRPAASVLCPDVGHSFTHSRCIAVWLESPAAPEPLLGRVHKPFYQDGCLYPSDSAPERRRALR